MWRSAWVYLQRLRGGNRVSPRHDRADMGMDLGLDASLEPVVPPLMEVAAARRRDPSDSLLPLGTDQRSRF